MKRNSSSLLVNVNLKAASVELLSCWSVARMITTPILPAASLRFRSTPTWKTPCVKFAFANLGLSFAETRFVAPSIQSSAFDHNTNALYPVGFEVRPTVNGGVRSNANVGVTI